MVRMVEPEVARFQCLVGVSRILERKALIDVNAHLSRSHHLEQLIRGSFERIASLYEMEEEWARQKQRTLLRQQNGRHGIDGTGGLPERHHQSAWSQTIERAQECILAD